MKKVLFFAAAFAFVAGVSSCKSDYECCTTTTSDGFEAEACVTQELSKSEAEDVESAGTSSVNGTESVTKCTKK